jgi:hypothetical protein
MAKMATLVPAQKVSAAALVGALTTIVFTIIEKAANTQVPSYLATSIMTVVSFLVAYLVPPAARDQVETS